MNGLHSGSGTEATLLSAMKQKCLQISNRISSLGVNQHRTRSFHVSSDGLFSTCFSRPTSADGEACPREDGSCATPGFIFRRSACLACRFAWESVRVHAPNSEPASGSVWRRTGFVQPGSNKTRLWIYFWFVCLGNDSLRSHWRIKTLLRMNSSLFLPIILLSCELAYFFSFFKQKKRTSADSNFVQGEV